MVSVSVDVRERVGDICVCMPVYTSLDCVRGSSKENGRPGLGGVGGWRYSDTVVGGTVTSEQGYMYLRGPVIIALDIPYSSSTVPINALPI